MGPAKPIPPNDTRAGLESATLEKVNKVKCDNTPTTLAIYA